MTIDVEIALQLSDVSYNEIGTPLDTPTGWDAIQPSTQVSSGFTGNAFYNSSSNTVVIGFGGTNGAMDLWADA